MKHESETETLALSQQPELTEAPRWQRWAWTLLAAVITALGLALLVQPVPGPKADTTSPARPAAPSEHSA